MLTSLNVGNKHYAVSLDFIFNSISNGFVVEKIEGLDPVKATLVSSSFANLDGAQYHSSRRDPRNIIITLGLKPGSKSASELRAELYQVFMPKTEVKLTFKNHINELYKINGVVETYESDLFIKEPKVVISLMCFEPDFVRDFLGSGSHTTQSDAPSFEFDYTGTIPTGYKFTVHATQPVSEFTIYTGPAVITADSKMTWLRFTAPLYTGDSLVIETTPGKKQVTLTAANSVSRSAMYGVTPDSGWPFLAPGRNRLNVYAPAGIIFDFEWLIKHGGL